MRETKKERKRTIQKPKRLPFPTLRIDCYGKSTYVYLDGMEITSGVTEIKFRAGGMKDGGPVLELKMEPHAVTLRRVKKERIETSCSTDRHSLPKRKSWRTAIL